MEKKTVGAFVLGMVVLALGNFGYSSVYSMGRDSVACAPANEMPPAETICHDRVSVWVNAENPQEDLAHCALTYEIEGKFYRGSGMKDRVFSCYVEAFWNGHNGVSIISL